MMTSRQCEIAAESYAAYLLAQAGYDVLIQYGANQPLYDLIANKGKRFLPISVKGSQNGAWPLAVKFKKNSPTYHDAIDRWLESQHSYIIFIFVQFKDVTSGTSPRAYIARPKEIAKYMKTQCDGRGHASLQEDCKKDHPNSIYSHKIPNKWKFLQKSIDSLK